MARSASDDLIDALAQATFDILPVLSRIAAELDLSLTQLRLLGVLRDHEPRIVELAGILGLDKSSVSQLVDRAAERDLVQRARDESDKRVVKVVLGAHGQDLIAQGEARMAAQLQSRLAGIPEDEQHSLADGIHSLLDVLAER